MKLKDLSKVDLAKILLTHTLYESSNMFNIGMNTKTFLFNECIRLGLFKKTLQETKEFYSICG